MTPNNLVIAEMTFLTDGKILAGGNSSTSQNALLRVNSDGSFDAANTQISNGSGSGYTVAVQPDGKIIVGGQFYFANGISRSGLTRFNADGSLDTSFNAPNINTSGAIYNIELQPDGKIIVPVWLGSSGFTYRLNSNGTTDFLISNTPYAHDAKYLPDGKFLVAHGDRVRRYNSNGSLDNT